MLALFPILIRFVHFTVFEVHFRLAVHTSLFIHFQDSSSGYSLPDWTLADNNTLAMSRDS